MTLPVPRMNGAPLPVPPLPVPPKYLVIAGNSYYPSEGTKDWKGLFDDAEQAMDLAVKLHKNTDWVTIVEISGTQFKERKLGYHLI